MTASSPKGDHASGIERAAPGEVRVRRALLSVSDKHGIVDFAQGLAEAGQFGQVGGHFFKGRKNL